MPLWTRQTAVFASAAALSTLWLAVPALAAPDFSLGDGAGLDDERLMPGVYPVNPVLANGQSPDEPYDPFFDASYSLALRGTYTRVSDEDRFDVRLVPTLGFEQIGTRSAIDLEISAEFTRPLSDESIDVSALRLDLEAGYALDSVTQATFNADLELTQALPETPGLDIEIATAPQTLVGTAELGLTRQFGRVNVGVTGEVERTVYGETELVDDTTVGNSDQNYWSLDAGLRVGLQASPIWEVFGQANVGRDILDVATSPSTGTSLRAGVVGRWNSVLEASASAGLGLRRFDDASTGEVVTQLYDAQVTFTPDPTWRMTAALETAVSPPGPDGSGTARVDYIASAEVGYTVNSWLALRALADWSTTRFAESSDTQTGYSVGAGADYNLNAHTALSADYDYDRVDSTEDGLQQAHRVTLGVTLSR